MKRLILSLWLVAVAGALPCPAAETDEEAAREAEFQKAREERIAEIQKRMAFFDAYLGEWEGKETYTFGGSGEEKTLVTDDRWKGEFTLEGTHFEMSGVGTDDKGRQTSYRWICTYEPEQEAFRAWYFDSNGSSEQFEMLWDAEEKTLRWNNEDEQTASTFTMKAQDNTITGEGETTDAASGTTLYRHELTYTRKRISI